MREHNEGVTDSYSIMYFGKKTKYRELINEIQVCASKLYSLGVRKGDIVSLQLLTMPQAVVLFYAIGYLGAIANFIYITANESETKKILQETNSKLFFCLNGVFEDIKSVICQTGVSKVIICGIGDEADFITKTIVSFKGKGVKQSADVLSWKSLKKIRSNTVEDVVDGDLPAAMVYTSGTTGNAKAVVLSHKNINALPVQYQKTGLQFVRGEKFMNAIPIFVAYGLVFGVHVPLSLGLTDILNVNPSPNSLGDQFVKYRPNYLVQGLAGVDNIIKNKKIQKMNLDFIKVLGVGGDEIPNTFVEQVNDFLNNHNSNIHLVIGYGMTEVAATVVTSTPLVNRIGSVGIPLPATLVKIVEEGTEKEVTYGQVGEICFHAPTMMTGYYKKQSETDLIIKKHEDGKLWVHSGDLGTIDIDGFVYVQGRIKRMIGRWTEGVYHKVVPKIIEDCILQNENVIEATVVSKRISNTENQLYAFMVLNSTEKKEKSISEIKMGVKSRLELWEQVDEYRVIDKLPRNLTGKVDYRKLEELCENA